MAQTPTSGGGTVFGYDIQRGSEDIRKHVGYLAQDPRFYDYMTARETLRFTARFFYTDPDLDFTLVAVGPMATDGKTPLAIFGWLHLLSSPGKVLVGISKRCAEGVTTHNLNTPDAFAAARLALV